MYVNKPTDLTSRETSPEYLRDSTLWFYGPNSLKDALSHKNTEVQLDTSSAPEQTITRVYFYNAPHCKYHKSHEQFYRIIAYCRRFSYNITAKLSIMPFRTLQVYFQQ